MNESDINDYLSQSILQFYQIYTTGLLIQS